jgi:hypothetical protein
MGRVMIVFWTRRDMDAATKIQITIASSPIESIYPSWSIIRIDRITTYPLMTWKY